MASVKANDDGHPDDEGSPPRAIALFSDMCVREEAPRMADGGGGRSRLPV